MPIARWQFSTSTVNGKIYAMGCTGFVGLCAIVEEYDTGFAGESVKFKGKLPTTWGDVRTATNR